MTKILNFKDWAKLELRVGIIKEIKNNKVKINCNDKSYLVNLNFGLKVGDKIIVGIQGEKLILPRVGDNVILTPEKEIEIGSKVM